MSQFIYRLQPLMEQKEELRKAADQEVVRREQELQAQLARLQQLEHHLRELMEKRQQRRRDLMRAQGQSALTAAQVLERSEFVKVLGSEIQLAESHVSAQREVVEACEGQLQEAKEHAAEAKREVEVLDKHREKQKERFLREEQVKEEAVLDEIGNVLYSTGRRPT